MSGCVIYHDMETIKNGDKMEGRDDSGRFTKGHKGGPGRPKGTSLKEFWIQRLKEMTPNEKEEFAGKVTNDLIWKMAEGNPHQTQYEQIDTTIHIHGLPKAVLKKLNGINRKTK